MQQSRTIYQVIFVILVSMTGISDADAEENRSTREHPAGSLWTLNFESGYVHQFDADSDHGDGFSADRFFVQGGPGYRPNYYRSISLSVGYEYHSYDFGGAIANYTSPWQDVHTLRFSTPVRWGNAGSDLTFIAVPVLRFTAENASDWSDGFTGGGFAGVSYKVSERLIIGPGLGAVSQIEESVSVFPILIISWKITDKLTLATGKGIAATQGPGLTLNWRMTDNLSFFAGGRYEKNRFRLDDNGAAPGGIGEDSSFPLFGGLNYAFTKDIKVSIIGGISIGGQLSLEDTDGNLLAEEDYSSAPFLGVTVSGKM